jgi:RNA polymerase sigma factor (sigma-70 family)
MRGNSCAEAVCVETYITELRRFARALCRGDRERAEDLVQDCLERAVSRWHARRPDGNLRGWLYTILYHGFLNEERRRRRRGDSQRLEQISEIELPGVEGGQHAAIEHRDLLRALATLAPEQRAVLLLVGVDDFSYAQAARTLNVPIGTVMSRLSRARERLRQSMYGEHHRLRAAGRAGASAAAN